ncbi:MAG TPA: trehalase family glycosidase [Ktedonobacteraceae bacterium]|nr:trehalase family glycosidase [Ktedonobacteraceae bacterium]
MPTKYHFCNSLSWESGQDVSTRFGPQQTGGSIIQHVRPVDLQASMAQGAEILARWAGILAETGIEIAGITFADEIATWQQVANDYTARTRLMWRNGWFRDYDSVAKEWSAEQDAMHLAPVFCGVADWEQIERLRPALAEPPSNNPYWRPLSWPPIIMTVAEAASVAGMPAEAAELAYRFIDASYRSIDSRTPDEYGNIPGITRENRRLVTSGKWGATDYVNSGIEGYGWGAVSVFLLLRHLLGLHEEKADVIKVAPVFPQALRRVGATYHAGPVPWGKYLLHFQCIVRDSSSYSMQMRCAVQTAPEAPQGVVEHQWAWEGAWGDERVVHLP